MLLGHEQKVFRKNKCSSYRRKICFGSLSKRWFQIINRFLSPNTFSSFFLYFIISLFSSKIILLKEMQSSNENGSCFSQFSMFWLYHFRLFFWFLSIFISLLSYFILIFFYSLFAYLLTNIFPLFFKMFLILINWTTNNVFLNILQEIFRIASLTLFRHVRILCPYFPYSLIWYLILWNKNIKQN